MEPDNNQNPNSIIQPQFDQVQPSRRKWWLIGIILLVIIGVAFALITLLGDSKDKNNQTGTNGTDTAANVLFSSLEKAATKEVIHVAQFRTTYATKADLEASKDPGFIQSSVAEVDLRAGKYSNVFAQRTFNKDTFTMQRCVNNTPYIDGQAGGGDTRPAPTTLADANEYLKKMYTVTVPIQFITCPNLGMFPGENQADLAPARLSDGLMPVTLKQKQAAKWKATVLESKLFTVKDEGMTDHDGKQYRKYSLKPRQNPEQLDDQLSINDQLYSAFYEAAGIEALKETQPEAKWMYSFIAINPARQGGIEGFYLIDEATGLPAYSELMGINKDRNNGRPSDRANIGFNKQAYAYPADLTLTENSPLEIMQ